MDTEVIGAVLWDYYMGMSYKQIARGLQHRYGIPKPSKKTIYTWVNKFTDIATDATKDLKATVGDEWVADELFQRVNGRQMYHWNIMDKKTRYVLASYLSKKRDTAAARKVLQQALDASATGPPKTITTDKWAPYLKPIQQLMPHTKHILSEGIHEVINNNMSERLQGTLRSRLKTTRGLGTQSTGQHLLDGLIVTYNFFREHEGIDDKTPGEMAKVNTPYQRWTDVVTSATKRYTKPKRRRSGHVQGTLSQYKKRPSPEIAKHLKPRTKTRVDKPTVHTRGSAPRPELPQFGTQGKLPFFKTLPHPAVATFNKVRIRKLRVRVAK